MKQSEISRWLKGITIGLGIMGLIFFGFLVPILAKAERIRYPELAFLYWPGLAYSWIIAAVCYGILYQFWTVCGQIGRDNSFSRENSRAFVNMSRLSVVLGVVWFLGLVLLCVKGWMPSGVALAFMMLAIFLSAVLAIISAALSHLILKAYELKKENELTI